MKKFLPKLALIIIFGVLLVSSVTQAFAQTPPAATVAPTSSAVQQGAAPTPATGTWIQNDEVTFVGKMARRSSDFLNWELKNFQWVFVPGGIQDPLRLFWVRIRNIVYVF